jgi:integrase
MAAYEQAYNDWKAGNIGQKQLGAGKTKPGSVDAALIGYYQSEAFKGLAKVTQQNRRAILENFRNECGTFPLKSPYLGQGLQTIINRKKPAAQRNFKKAMRGFIKYCRSHNLMKDDPLAGLELNPMKTKGHHTWTWDEIKQYRNRHPPGTKPRLGLELLLQTGHSSAEVVRMGRQLIKDGKLRMKRQKTGVEFAIPLLPELVAEIARHPKSNMAYLISERGTPYASAASFGNQFAIWCKQAGLVGCSAHGLRKASAVRHALNGATAPELMRWHGWKTLAIAQRYIDEADSIRLVENAANKMRTGIGTPLDPGAQSS